MFNYLQTEILKLAFVNYSVESVNKVLQMKTVVKLKYSLRFINCR